MKTVLQHILRKKRDFARRPLFDHLRDTRLSPADRLAFFPCMAPFILCFGDFNRYVLRTEPTDDPHLQTINRHTYEDDHHWPWYLEDFAELGHDDVPVAPGDTMRFLWSDATAHGRLLSTRLAHLVWSAEPAVRLAIVEAIEETGNVLFALTAEVARTIQRDEGKQLRYLGDFHFQLESGHAMNNDHADLAAIALDDTLRADAIRRVDQVFAWFADWTDELHRHATQVLARRYAEAS